MGYVSWWRMLAVQLLLEETGGSDRHVKASPSLTCWTIRVKLGWFLRRSS